MPRGLRRAKATEGAAMRFQGRGALVSGGGAGIGRATCLALAREGAAAVILVLASDAASDVHGAIVDVNGGLL